MEPRFDQLLSAKIKRLGKSTVVLDEPTLSNANTVGVSSSDLILTSSSQTQHPDTVKVGEKNFYVSEFGKVYTGEIFRGLIIMSNKSPRYALTDVEITVYSTCQNKGQQKKLVKRSVPRIEAGSAFSTIIDIRADFTDTYVLDLRAKYKSEFYRERLRQMDVDTMSPSQRNRLQNRESYHIDYTNRDVTRSFTKKFKFQTRSPFQLSQTIVVRQNKYFMEITLENESTQLYLQTVQLKLSNADLECTDLNPLDEDGEMIGSIMKKKEK